MADESKPTKISNPAPLGLLGFGLTTVLLSLCNMGLMPLDNVVLAMGVFVGGAAQILAGIMEYRNGNTFGTTAFTLYGMFWMSFVFIKFDPSGLGATGTTLGAYLLMWGILTLFLFLGTFKGRNSLKFVFLTLTITFLILSVGDFTHIGTLAQIGGTVGLICGLAAMYTAFAEVLAEQHGREVLPF